MSIESRLHQLEPSVSVGDCEEADRIARNLEIVQRRHAIQADPVAFDAARAASAMRMGAMSRFKRVSIGKSECFGKIARK